MRGGRLEEIKGAARRKKDKKGTSQQQEKVKARPAARVGGRGGKFHPPT